MHQPNPNPYFRLYFPLVKSYFILFCNFHKKYRQNYFCPKNVFSFTKMVKNVFLEHSNGLYLEILLFTSASIKNLQSGGICKQDMFSKRHLLLLLTLLLKKRTVQADCADVTFLVPIWQYSIKGSCTTLKERNGGFHLHTAHHIITLLQNTPYYIYQFSNHCIFELL